MVPDENLLSHNKKVRGAEAAAFPDTNCSSSVAGSHALRLVYLGHVLEAGVTVPSVRDILELLGQAEGNPNAELSKCSDLTLEALGKENAKGKSNNIRKRDPGSSL